jgi:protein-S-isoprenylcysteine O-methyltransferase Ste14
MTMSTNLPFELLWGSWGIYWLARAGGGKVNTWREPLSSRLLHIVPLVIAGLLLTFRLPWLQLNQRFVAPSLAIYWTGVGITAGGLLFAVWARRHLGRNWSGTVTIKAGHELITSGPYAIVRHPIYTGLLFGFAGSALAVGEWRGLLALGIVTLALWRKLRVEELGMRRLFGETYARYAKRVRALIPGVY